MKYTPQSALAIKRDVQKNQERLEFILGEIDTKRQEIVVLDSVLAEKRGIVGRFEDMILSVFQKETGKVANLTSRRESLEETILKLESAKDLLNAQILLQKEQVSEPTSAVLVSSVIINLSQTLDALLSKIDASETELAKLEQQKKDFIASNKKLESDIVKQEGIVRVATQKMLDIEKNREKQLKELAREKQALSQMRAREHDSEVMHRRLSADYQKVYQATPRRANKN